MPKAATVSLVVALITMGLGECASAQSFPPNSVWVNQRGSTLTITSVDGATGEFRGEYVNNAAGFDCKGTPYAVVGWVESDKVAFSVRWKSKAADCESITSWAGYLESGVLITHWDIAYTDAIVKHPLMMRGSDIFRRK